MAGGTITWRVQLGGADQARAEFKSLGDAGAQAATTTGSAWDAAGQQTGAATSQVRVLADAWRAADAERRNYASDMRSSGLQQPPTALQQQQAVSASAAQTAQQRVNASIGVGGSGKSAADSASAFQAGFADQAREMAAQRVAQEEAMAAAAQAAQSRINATIGVGATGAGSAELSAAAFAEQLTAMEKLEARASTLKSALDPLYAAQQKYGAAVKEAGTLVEAGVITEGEHAAAVGAARVALEDAEKAALKTGAGYHLTSVQAMELEHSARAMVDAVMSGRNPFQALTMEGGRLAQVMGEGKGGVAGSFTALRSLVSAPLGAVGALTTALLLAAAAEGSYLDAQRKSELALTGAGRRSGQTAETLEATAEAAGRTGNVSVGAARDIEQAFLHTGTIGAEVFPGLIALQRDFAASMGLSSKAATDELAKSFADPARGAEALNQTLHFLSDAELQHIRDLQEAGERTQAQTEMMNALSVATAGAADNLSTLDKGLHNTIVFFQDAWNWSGKFLDNLQHIGSTKLQAINEQISFLQAAPLADQGQLKELIRERDAIVNAPKAAAATSANEASGRAGADAREYDPAIEQRRHMQDQLDDLQKQAAQGFQGVKPEERAEDERLLQALPRAIATALSPQEREVREAAIRAELASRPGSARRGQLQEEQARLQTAGQVLTPVQADAIAASGRLQGENRGARVDNATAKRAEAEANKANAADKAATDLISKSQDATNKADETIATAKGQQAKAALEAVAADVSLSDGERRSRMAQAAAELGIQNAKDDQLKLALQRIEQDRARQLSDVGHQTTWTAAQRTDAARAINAAADEQARAARAQDAAKLDMANGAASVLGSQFQAAALKSRASDVTLPTAARAAAEQKLLDLQQAEASARLETTLQVKGVTSATADRARTALTQSQAAELQLATDTQVRQLAQAGMEAAKGLATTQTARDAIEREQLKISQDQRTAATQILIAQLDEAVAHGLMARAVRDQLAGQLSRATTNLNGSEQEALRRQQLTSLGKLYDPSQQQSPRDVAEGDAAEASGKLSSALVELEQNTTTFGKALRDVVGSIEGTVLKQLTDRALAPVDRLIDQGIDKLFPAAADTGTTTANAAMAQSASAATLAINSLAQAAATAATRMGVSGVSADGTPGFDIFGGGSTAFAGFNEAGTSAADVAGFFAGGGLISGRGTGTSDSNLARVSHGEYIVNARATAQHYDLIDHINAGGSLPGFAAGGYYGDDSVERRRRYMASPAAALAANDSGANGGGDVHLHNHTGQPMKASKSRGANGDLVVALTPMFERAARGRATDPNGLGRDLRMVPKTLIKRS